MKTVGIIAEFNPLHNGHKYLLDEAKRLSGADFCIVVMSGNFVQRGSPALLDKYTRTQMALLNGVDLVIELPVIYATASAEYFARGAVRLLDKLGVVDIITFGSECGNIELLKKAATELTEETPDFKKNLQDNLKKGLSFPKARSQAIGKQGDGSEPNNILGIEYIKALNYWDSSITPTTIERKGSGYHDEQMASATAIRKMEFTVV